jgi:serine phosphatase RsbU (regulator of sigma subunit)
MNSSNTSKKLNFFLFVIFVLVLNYVFWVSAKQYYFSSFNHQKDKVYHELDNILDGFDDFVYDKKFFHHLLLNKCNKANLSKSPLQAIRQNIIKLKKKFPGSFKFIVWNKKGQIQKHLSDISEYKYVQKKMFQTLKKISTQNSKSAYKPDKKLQNLLKKVFGEFLTFEQIKKSLQRNAIGECALTSNRPDKKLTFFYHSSIFSLTCFISKNILNKNIGLKHYITSLNSVLKNKKIGFINLENGFLSDSGYKQIIKRESAKFEHFFSPLRETNDLFILFKQISPEIRVFAYISKNEKLESPREQRNLLFFTVFKYIAILLFIFYCFSLRHSNTFISVKTQLTLLILISNLLPILVILTLSKEFVLQTEKVQNSNLHSKNLKKLRVFDEKFLFFKESYAQKLNDFINRLNKDKKWNNFEVQQLKKFLPKVKPNEAFIIDKTGNTTILTKNKKLLKKNKTIVSFFANALALFNPPKQQNISEKRKGLEKLTNRSKLYFKFLHCIGKITKQNFGSEQKWTFIRFLGDRKHNKNWGILVVGWNLNQLQKIFWKKQLFAFNRQNAPNNLVLMANDLNAIFPVSWENKTNLRHVFKRIISNKIYKRDNIRIDFSDWFCTAILSRHFHNTSLMLLSKNFTYKKKVQSTLIYLLILETLSLLLAIFFVRYLSKSMLSPIKDISQGIAELGKKNFTYKIKSQNSNPWSKITEGFNHAIENMGELEIGKTVQESLFPNGVLQKNKIEIFAKSVSMTNMGGDYFDFFETKNDELGIIFGDVAGHGSSAALLVSMAKAVVVNFAEKLSLEELINKLNEIFLHLKNQKWIRMMTAQCLSINDKTGAIELVNAGHCFPIKISNKGKEIDLIKAYGLPLGTKGKFPRKPVSLKLAPGDTIILYTDGFIESKNACSEALDVGGFSQILKECWTENLQDYYQRVWNRFLDWNDENDDDVTILFLRFKDNEEK